MNEAELRTIPLEQITLSGTEAQKARRQRFNPDTLDELAESIRSHGVLQPIIVRPMATDYELVAGERRYAAAKKAGLAGIPAVVRSLTDERVIEVQLIENLQRTDVHPMEEAEGYQQLMKVHGHPIEELHTRVGKSRSYVYGRIKLLALSQTCRKAFYADEISASVALLLARIPVEKLQNEALKEIKEERGWREPMSYRRAKEFVHERYMLRLKDAPFPTDDEKLVPKAGPCGSCPKRTGNQPELFGDVQGADVCTDPSCFEKKANAHGQRRIEAARQAGRTVITGAEAKRVAPHAGHGFRGALSMGPLMGYTRVDARRYHNGRDLKVRTIIGKDAETALLQVPKTGQVVEVVKDSVLAAAARKGRGPGTTTQDDGTRERRRKAKQEKAFRSALYAELRPKLAAPGLRDLARTIFDRLEHDSIKELCRIRGFTPLKPRGHVPPDYRSVGRVLEQPVTDGADVFHAELVDDAELATFINDCIYARELQVPAWSDAKPEMLLAAAKAHGVDPAAIRRQVAPSKKTKRKKAGKKKAAKKATKKKVARTTAARKGS